MVCLITPRSVVKPWILYEAGLARGAWAERVYGCLFGVPMHEVAGPFKALQNAPGDGAHLVKQMMQIGRSAGLSPHKPSIERLCNEFEQKIAAIDFGASAEASTDPVA